MVGAVARRGHAAQPIAEIDGIPIVDHVGKSRIDHGLDAVPVNRLALRILPPVFEAMCGHDIAGIRKHRFPAISVVVGVPAYVVDMEMRHQHGIDLPPVHSCGFQALDEIGVQVIEQGIAIAVTVIAYARVNDDEPIGHAYDPAVDR